MKLLLQTWFLNCFRKYYKKKEFKFRWTYQIDRWELLALVYSIIRGRNIFFCRWAYYLFNFFLLSALLLKFVRNSSFFWFSFVSILDFTKNKKDFFFIFFISHSPSLPVLSTTSGGNMMPTTPSSSSSSASSTHLQVIGSSVVSSQQQSGPQASPQAPTYVNL